MPWVRRRARLFPGAPRRSLVQRCRQLHRHRTKARHGLKQSRARNEKTVYRLHVRQWPETWRSQAAVCEYEALCPTNG